ncbi:nuclear transport factor 2 family protein [Paraburkholderia sp. A1RI-2L]|uniref:nuclear transport factor 2 family protein n=1 Tax=Paraburkholderia sp. A1RI-2L TaxID=3028367 RepID=UPI003B76E736
MNDASLHERVARLEAVEAIRELKARYAALADAKYTSTHERQPADVLARVAWDQALCFTEDAVWEGGAGFGDSLVGRAQLHEWFKRSPWCFAAHYYGSPQFDIRADEASGTWRLWQLAMREDTREVVLLAAVTRERYRRDADGAWRCAYMNFAQIHLAPLGAGASPLAATLAALDAARSVRA